LRAAARARTQTRVRGSRRAYRRGGPAAARARAPRAEGYRRREDDQARKPVMTKRHASSLPAPDTIPTSPSTRVSPIWGASAPLPARPRHR
jgi:hypothetical protein